MIAAWNKKAIQQGDGLAEADIYLIDEPSAYLDVEQRVVAARVMKRLRSDCLIAFGADYVGVRGSSCTPRRLPSLSNMISSWRRGPSLILDHLSSSCMITHQVSCGPRHCLRWEVVDLGSLWQVDL